jgi:predicted aspartyl protease
MRHFTSEPAPRDRIVDDRGRALLEIDVAKSPGVPSTSITSWIDTAFDGHLVFSQNLIDELGL